VAKLADFGCAKRIHQVILSSTTTIDLDGSTSASTNSMSLGKSTGMGNTGKETNPADLLRTVQGSVPWMAPEVIKQTGHGMAVDIWSIGCILVEMMTATRPWPEFTNNMSALYHIATSNQAPPFPDTLSLEMQDFLWKCFRIEPSQRPSASRLLKHAFSTGESLGV